MNHDQIVRCERGEQMKFEDWKLGDVIWESDPWEGKVYRRQIIREKIVTTYDTLFEKVDKCNRSLTVSGGFMGFGEELTSSTWLSRYFPDKESARRHCAEQSLKLKREREEQIRKEIEDLQGQLGSQETKA